MYSVKMQEYIEKTTTQITPAAEGADTGKPGSGQAEGFAYPQMATTQIDSQNYFLSIKGLVKKSLCLSLDDLREDFPRVTLAASISGDDRIQPTPLTRWGGIRLRHLLLASGIEPSATHVIFLGLNDRESRDSNVVSGGSIPINKAMSPEVLLAYEMDGQALSPANGYPLRVIVPGYEGTCSVKWINEINLFKNIEGNPGEGQAQSSQGNSIKVLISRPQDGETVLDEVVVIEGHAVASGGRLVRRVELSTDEGKTWKGGQIHKTYNPWVWCAWESHLRLTPGVHKILVRAWDSAGHVSHDLQTIKVRVAEED
jgi:sulfite oxidase